MGLMAFYLVSFVIRLFGVDVTFLQSASLLGIGFSLFAAGLAAMNLASTSTSSSRVPSRACPKGMEWYAAFALVITLVWLYLELLRLLSKLQRR